ncbi:MAG: amidase [Gemmatimonadetes bacterium]|nr:amidase [Gemmatimonadota bacterium]
MALLSAVELRRRVADGELSPVDVLDACLEQIDRHNDRINALVTPDESATEQARELERRLAAGENPGSLCGLPVGIKDTTPVAGLRTTYGSPLYADHVPDEDALVVRRLREAGAVILGKTNTPEFAAGGNTFNEVFGRTRNPWNPELSAGGSTGGGAAALAAGMIALAEGTDLGGSLRVPASFCGVVGLRPSPGLVPTVPTEWPADDLSVTGPMGRTVADVALMLEAVSGPIPTTTTPEPGAERDFVGAVRRGPAEATRVAYAPDLAGLGADPALERVCREAAESLELSGANVEGTDLDLSDGFEAFLTLRGRWMVEHHRSRLGRLAELGPNLAGNIRAGLALAPARVAAAEQSRERLRRKMGDLFERYDYLLTPCVPVPPFPVEQDFPETIGGRKMDTYIEWIAPTFVLTLTDLPVACVPAGLDASGLPVGIQVVGPPRGEESVLALAGRIEELRPIGRPPGVE